MKILLVIPCYQHARQLVRLLEHLRTLKLPALVVNDGSDRENSALLQSYLPQYDFMSLLEHKGNQGKGAAVLSGFRWGQENGYTHVFQIDSDGQHDFAAQTRFLQLAQANPDALVAGYPVYDESIPLARKIGRHATHLWVWIETLGFEIKDSMCGFRIYPLASVCDERMCEGIGLRMDFDIEMMVRLYWQRHKIIFSPVLVKYPADGVSNFKAWRDNWMISKMHTRLFFGMLQRCPSLLGRKLHGTRTVSIVKSRSNLPPEQVNWAKINEKGSTIGIALAVWVMVHFNRVFLNMLLRFITFYYAVGARSARKSSILYRSKYYQYCRNLNIPFEEFSFLTHINACVDAIRDKFLVWSGRISIDDFAATDLETFETLARNPRGAVFISAHFGNIEIARALGRKNPHKKINALVYTDNAIKMNQALGNLNQDFSLNLISVAKFGPEVAVSISEKVEAGEWIFIMGDRIPVNQSGKGIITARVLDEEARLAEGPFLMAYLLDCPIYSFFCYKKEGHYRIALEDIMPSVPRTQTNRRPFIGQLVDNYCRRLEDVIRDSPTQWFNFYPFWNPS